MGNFFLRGFPSGSGDGGLALAGAGRPARARLDLLDGLHMLDSLGVLDALEVLEPPDFNPMPEGVTYIIYI